MHILSWYALTLDGLIWINPEQFTIGRPLLLAIAILTFSVLVASILVTFSYAIYTYYRDQRREAIQDRLLPELITRLRQPDPAWAAWVDTLSAAEQDVLLELIERNLELLLGEDRTKLVELAETVGLDETAKAAITSGSSTSRLEGMRRLSLLEESVDAEWLLEHLSEEQTEKEVASTVLAIEPVWYRKYAVGMVLDSAPLSVYGLDALYELCLADPRPLFEWLTAEHRSANERVLAQVLLVLDRIEPTYDDVDVDGVLQCLTHPDPVVRGRACLVLGDFGWIESIRKRVPVGAVTLDSSPFVRRCSYLMLHQWGREQSINRLRAGLFWERDPLARLTLAYTLIRSPTGQPALVGSDLEPDDLISTWAGQYDVDADLRGSLV